MRRSVRESSARRVKSASISVGERCCVVSIGALLLLGASQVRSKRGILKTLVVEELYRHPQLRSTFGPIVGMTLQVREHSTRFKRGQGTTDGQRAMVERDMNAVWTDMLMALKNAGLLKVPPPPTPYRSF